jgi:type IV secretion system protein VirB2
MKNRHITHDAKPRRDRGYLRTLASTALATAIIVPGIAMAQAAGGQTAVGTACGFLSSIQNLLNAVSIVVVTIAIIFSGYQIAFAHKRISDVAPVMIGAILIGAAGQIARMFLSNSAGTEACQPSASIAPDALSHMVAAAQWLLLQHA